MLNERNQKSIKHVLFVFFSNGLTLDMLQKQNGAK